MEKKFLADYKGLETTLMQVKFLKEEYLDDLLNGSLFMNNFKYFIELEKEMKQKGQGDKLEAGLIFRGKDVQAHHKGTVVGQFQFVETVVRYEGAEKVPLFCFTQFTSEDLEVVKEYKDSLLVKVSISEEEQEKFIENAYFKVPYTNTNIDI